MILPSHPEQMLISALLNHANVLAAEEFGVTRKMFSEYAVEYGWLIDFRMTRGYEPEEAAFLHAFPDFTVLGITDVSYSAELVREHHSRQQLSALARGTGDLLRSNTDPGEIISVLSSGISDTVRDLNTGSSLINTIDDAGADVDRILELLSPEDRQGIPFFHQSLAARAWGQQPGEITVVAARTNQGKSWILGNEAAHAVLAGKKVLYWAGEMTEAQMRTRLLTIWFNKLGIGNYTHNLLNKGYEKGIGQIDALAFKSHRQELIKHLPGQLFIPDISHGLTTPTTIAGWISQYEPDLVVIDHITLMGDSTGQRASMGWNVVASITGELKTIATGMKVPIMTASQINRDGDSKTMLAPPKLVNLAQSDSVGQDADNVLTMVKWKGTPNALVYSLEKARSSQAGLRWWSRFDPNHGNFAEITKVEADELYFAAQEDGDEY